MKSAETKSHSKTETHKSSSTLTCLTSSKFYLPPVLSVDRETMNKIRKANKL